MYRVAVGNDVLAGYLNVSFRGDWGANPPWREDWRRVPSRNFIKRVFACFHSGHARFYRPYNATGSKRHDNTIQFVVASRICAYMRARPRACMHACMPTGRELCGRSPRRDRSRKLRNESPRALTLLPGDRQNLGYQVFVGNHARSGP